MKCAYHQDSIAVGQCSNCGCYVCPQCYTMVNEKMYCNMCAGHMFRQEPIAKVGTPPAIVSGNISGPVTAAVVPQEIKKTNWLERHLNWSLVLCGFLGAYVAAIVAGFLVGIVATVINPTVTDESLGTLGEVFGFCAALATLIGATVWYLKKKGRHMGHLAWLICPFGYIVLLCLENRSS